ncbi:hypothetical protein MHY_09160 [Megamonas hypermegale ART12/1]|nr:hypothetical protein MHY_09160 [Megamonas hypermegale ART12/1]
MQTQTNFIYFFRVESLLYSIFLNKKFLLMIKAVMYLNITAF